MELPALSYDGPEPDHRPVSWVLPQETRDSLSPITDLAKRLQAGENAFVAMSEGEMEALGRALALMVRLVRRTL